MQDPIVVYGMPRSGTSLTCGILKVCGAWGGDERHFRTSNENNPKGFFENSPLLVSLQGNVIKKLPTIVRYIPDVGTDSRCSPMPHKNKTIALEFMQRSGFPIPEQSPWFVKPLINWGEGIYLTDWIETFPDAKWILTFRNINDLFASIGSSSLEFSSNMRDQQSFQDALQERVFEQYFIKSEAQNVQEVWPFRSIGDTDPDLTKYRELVEWCGLTWEEEAVRKFIDLSLCHNRNDQQGLQVPNP